MRAVFADPKTDFVFKRIFGAESRKPLLVTLLNHLLELDGDRRILDVQHLQYVFLELPKYAAGDAPATLVDKWAFFFREAKNLDVVPPSLADAPFREALEVSRTAGFTADEWEAYERAKMAEQDARGALAIERQEGRAEGKRGTLRRLLERRGIALPDEDHATIAACESAQTLDRWCENVLDAGSIREVFK